MMLRYISRFASKITEEHEEQGQGGTDVGISERERGKGNATRLKRETKWMGSMRRDDG
jgi:hypothetical protein